MRYIDSFREGMHISDVYLCKNRQIALTKNGKEYGNLVLQDKTGTIDAKIWDLGSPGVGNFETLDYVYIDADVTVFMGANQLNVKRIRKADEGEYIPADYLPVSLKDGGYLPGYWPEHRSHRSTDRRYTGATLHRSQPVLRQSPAPSDLP